jgi:putative ABC transport system permease protein
MVVFNNYFKTALRNIWRQKAYSLINIFGLAIGIASCLAVLLWVLDEISYNNYHKNSTSIYRCYREVIWNNEIRYDQQMSPPVGPTINERTPGVLDFTRTYSIYRKLNYKNKSCTEWGILVDPSFLTIFTFPLAMGNPETALSIPNSIVLTRETADRLFGDTDPIGKILDNGLVVTGIANNLPQNTSSSLDFSFLVPFAMAEQAGLIDPDAWFHFGYETFFLLQNPRDADKISLQIRDLFKEIEPDVKLKLHLQPFTDYHLKSLAGGGRITLIYIFSAVAILILAIACINFVNLATARAARRMVEIGLRKAIGASRIQLGIQILIESAVQTVTAMLIAICLIEISLPLLEELYGKQLAFALTGDILIALLAIVLLTAIGAGIYPAFVLSSFRPATVLKKITNSCGIAGMNRIRRILVVFQFAISTGLIFGALIINSQMNYIDNKNLGIESENIICFRAENLTNDYETFKNELNKYPGILNVSFAMEPPAWCGWHSVGFSYEGKPEDHDLRAGFAWVDFDYVGLFGLEIINGRSFSKEFSTDYSEAYLVNETAARAMQMDDPIGKSLMEDEDRPGKIIGVVKDFHFSSLHDNIRPLILGINPTHFEFIFVKTDPNDIPGCLGYIEDKWNQIRPGEDFNYRFFTDYLGRSYASEKQTNKIILSFTIIAVIIASLGLLGLVSYSAERRKKEIGIRKVLGLTEPGIIWLLTKEFLWLVTLGYVIALPLAYYTANRWLENFAYQTKLSWDIFLTAGGLAVLSAVATVCYQAVMAARANPVDALKCE